ncbi:MAG: hypothetical protein AUJ72_04940 [Candidatus Omnitrophica bacterium CG1_02_46_14]|nr:MAG: hypothetical protein AUJ72_04940 [Candidatus Omnitrophica bacterium CG1_02_46_14]
MKKIRRACLKCDRIFMAEGRFRRLCPRCNQLISEHYSHILTGYIYPNTFYAIKPGSGPRKKPCEPAPIRAGFSKISDYDKMLLSNEID